jgi:glyoxylase-like metal-dependent hydrolase (beta-lactamase superfamily II)
MQISALREDDPVELPAGVRLIRADNPGVMSLTGTNTWILSGREGDATVVIDPGPSLPDHLAAIRSAGRPAAIVLTHHHLDHSEAAAGLAEEYDAPVYAALPGLARNTKPLADKDLLAVAGWELAVLATPGHTSDSVCLRIDGALLTGDTLLGGSTTIIAPPTGSLAEYFDTMRRLSALPDAAGLPGHGPAFASVGAWADQNARYRHERLAQLTETYSGVVAASPGAGDEAVLRAVASRAYGDGVRPAEPYVEAMVNAQLRFLGDRGDIPPWNHEWPSLR